MFVTNWISTTKIQKISEITNFFRHYFLSRTEVRDTEKRRTSFQSETYQILSKINSKEKLLFAERNQKFNRHNSLIYNKIRIFAARFSIS